MSIEEITKYAILTWILGLIATIVFTISQGWWVF